MSVTVDEARTFVADASAAGRVSLSVMDADEFFCDACTWETKRICVTVDFSANHRRQSKILARFDTFAAAQTFLSDVIRAQPKNVTVF